MQGRVALIVGGASGIGRASAEACANDGASIVVADLDEARGAEVVDGIRAKGGSATFAKVDITDEATVAAAVATTVREFGKLDALLTSAGARPNGDERWNQNIEMYLRGPYFACKHAIDAMIEAGGGAIVNVASIAGVVGGIGDGIDDSGYASAKHGVVGLSRTIALQYAKRNVRVNALCPGYIRTEMTRRFHGSADGGDALINEQLRVPMGRWGEPEELGKVAAFLLSDDASYLTGQAIVVDGGFTAR
jgi:NAD(P)-dependent dehydrogenase (short-subunit alcohol dehydrogenase family)